MRISPERKLSVKAVEDEANCGDGTAYYYKDVIQDIKKHITDQKRSSDNVSKLDQNSLRSRLKKESKLKDKYRAEIKSLKMQLSFLAAQNNEFAISIQQYKQRILELENNIKTIK
ncbi:hypothetical protein ACMAZF_19615 [Psychrobium sp. nBUS_13]|uniref:hypothetical protein n=1 Tax=Psychrobium sp. nBUS_13 TaxID=3395319 RepID=UPI003EBCAD41